MQLTCNAEGAVDALGVVVTTCLPGYVTKEWVCRRQVAHADSGWGGFEKCLMVKCIGADFFWNDNSDNSDTVNSNKIIIKIIIKIKHNG